MKKSQESVSNNISLQQHQKTQVRSDGWTDTIQSADGYPHLALIYSPSVNQLGHHSNNDASILGQCVEVGFLFAQQFHGMIKFADGALVEDEHSVVVEDGVETMSDGEDGDVDERLSNRLLNHGICLQIHRCRGFIQHHHLRISVENDTNSLLFGG